MKNIIVILISFLLYSTSSFCQKQREIEVLKSDSTWFKETIKFPISFANEIPYEGFADLRFAPGFTEAESPESWSYVWAWCITNIEKVTTHELEENLELYFNGLLGLSASETNPIQAPTVTLFITKENADTSLKFIGKIKTFDTRYTKKPLTLNVSVEATFCKRQKKSILIFRLSPKDFKHSVWKKLYEVTLIKNIRDNCNF